MLRITSLLLILCLSCQSKKQPETATENEDDTILLVDLEGNSITLEADITILNLWATWCKPCIAEMPDLAEMQAQLPDNFKLLLASDEPLERQQRLIKKQDETLNFVQLKSSLEGLGVYALPTTLIINKEGEILETMVGTRAWNTPEQIEQIKAYR